MGRSSSTLVQKLAIARCAGARAVQLGTRRGRRDAPEASAWRGDAPWGRGWLIGRRLALEPPPVPIPDCCKVESIGENPRLLLRIEKGFAGRPLRAPCEQLRRPDDRRTALVAAHFLRNFRCAGHDGETPARGFTIPFSVGPTPLPDCAGILGEIVGEPICGGAPNASTPPS
jgi:hypothetical protein